MTKRTEVLKGSDEDPYSHDRIITLSNEELAKLVAKGVEAEFDVTAVVVDFEMVRKRWSSTADIRANVKVQKGKPGPKVVGCGVDFLQLVPPCDYVCQVHHVPPCSTALVISSKKSMSGRLVSTIQSSGVLNSITYRGPTLPA